MRNGGFLAVAAAVVGVVAGGADATVSLRKGTPHAQGRWVVVFRNETSADARADHVVRHRMIADKVCNTIYSLHSKNAHPRTLCVAVQLPPAHAHTHTVRCNGNC
jgi:hypothetical protein